MLVANLPDDLEMFLDDHNLGVSSAAAFSMLHSNVSLALLCSSLHRRSERTHPAEPTSFVA
jgi:hypothetical protein